MKQQTSDTEGFNNIQTLLFGTVNGAIGVIAHLSKKDYEFLEKVQKAMTQVIKGIGGFSHENWRSFATDRKRESCKYFLDGDLIESFLDLKRDKMEEVVEKMNEKVTVEDLIKKIEELTICLH